MQSRSARRTRNSICRTAPTLRPISLAISSEERDCP
jgi:hypothetical protein